MEGNKKIKVKCNFTATSLFLVLSSSPKYPILLTRLLLSFLLHCRTVIFVTCSGNNNFSCVYKVMSSLRLTCSTYPITFLEFIPSGLCCSTYARNVTNPFFYSTISQCVFNSATCLLLTGLQQATFSFVLIKYGSLTYCYI